MKSKRSHENYVLIDNSASTGMPESLIHAAGIDPLYAVPGGVRLELPAYTCKHCQTEIIMNPLRTRERGYCPNCDHYICDRCNAIRLIEGCKTIDKVFDEILENIALSGNVKEL